MCFFTGDCDWTCGLQEFGDKLAEKDTHCHECGVAIKAGETLHWIYQQEAEDGCLSCEQCECECEEDKCCQCENPSVGETFHYHRCMDCNAFLAAVKEAELDAGCREFESVPLLTEMCESINNGGMDEAKKYFKRAAKRFPEWAKSGYLGRLWVNIFNLETTRA